MKLLFEVPTGKILGLQVVGGQGAEKRVDVVATAMKFNGTVFDLERLELAYAPPFGSAKDPVNMLGFIASNVLRGTMKIYHWHDLDEISDKNGFFLDVRTKEEFDLAHFEGAVNFSDLELRDHLDELPRNRPIYVNCQVGFRGYLSYRMLVQSGFTEVYNLTGGYKTYEYATMSREEFEPMSVNPKVKILEQSIGRPADDISGQKTIKTIDACGLSCPGPLSALVEGLRDLPKEQFLEIRATDPGFASSVKAYAELNEGVDLISLKKKGGVLTTTMYKTKDYQEPDERMKDIREDLEETPVRPVGLPVVSEITAQDLYNEMIGPNPPAIVIDVREKNEWKRGHIKGSTLIPLGEFQQRIPELEKYKKQEVIVLCQAGSRSYMAGRFLERSGFEYIRNLRGGIVSWVRSGFDYVR
jgi:rhodanese-related sulfurtransferase/TusA-related sulfurtransferase